MAEPAAHPEDPRRRAEESVALRFSRVMNATTSRLGFLCDPPFVALCSAPLLLAFLGALQMDASPGVVRALGALLALPLLVAVGMSVALFGARARVIDWLAGLPFPVENMNATLNGLGDSIEITFADACPSAVEVNRELDKVSQECFVTRAPDVEPANDGKSKPAPTSATRERVMEIRVGVADSKRNPASSNHKRYERVRALVGVVIVPLHARFPVVEARIK